MTPKTNKTLGEWLGEDSIQIPKNKHKTVKSVPPETKLRKSKLLFQNTFEKIKTLYSNTKISDKIFLSKQFEHKEIFFQFLKILGFYVSTENNQLNTVNGSGNFNTLVEYSGKHFNFSIFNHFSSRKKEIYQIPLVNLKKYKITDELDYHHKRMKKGSISFKENLYTKVMLVDIDTHDGMKDCKDYLYRENFQTLYNYIYSKLKVYPILAEYSKVGNGMHLYYLTDTIDFEKKKKIRETIRCIINNYEFFILKEKLNIIEKKFQCEKTVEFRSPNKMLRVPLANDYQPVDPQTFDDIDTTYEVFDLLYEIIKNEKQEFVLKYNGIADLLLEEKSLDSSLLDFILEMDNKQYIYPKKSYKQNSDWDKINIKITKGNRIGGKKLLFLLGYQAVYYNASFEDFVEKVKKSNAGSRELTKWFVNKIDEEKGLKELKYIYDFVHKYYSSDKLKTENSNNFVLKRDKNFKHKLYVNYKLTDDDKKFLWVFYRVILKGLKINDGSKRINKIAPFIFELFRKIREQSETKREILKSAKLTKDLKKKFEIGYQFPRRFLNSIKDDYCVRCDLINTTNTILYNSNVFIQYKVNQYGYYSQNFGHCRTFLIDFDYILQFKLKEDEIKIVKKYKRIQQDLFPDIIDKHVLVVNGKKIIEDFYVTQEQEVNVLEHNVM